MKGQQAPQLPNDPSRSWDDYFIQSFRLAPEQAAFLEKEAKGCGSISAFVCEILDDARALYGHRRPGAKR